MRYTYKSDFADFKAAQRAYVRSRFKQRFWFHFQMWGMLVLGMVFLVVFALLSHGPAWGVLEAGIVGGLIGGGVVCPLLRPWQIRRTYKMCSSDPSGRNEFYLEVEGATLLSGIKDRSEGRFQRSSICDVVEDENVMMLFLAKKRFLYLPKKKLPPEAFDEVRSWLQISGAVVPC